jgi:basic membrane protein A
MKTKRFFWVLMAIVVVSSLVLSACGGAEETEVPDVAPPEEAALKIGLVTDVGEIDDKSFNQSAWEGVQLSGEEFGAEVDYVETKDAKDYMANIELFTKNDFDIVVTVGFALGEATLEAAALYPDVYFIGVDQGQWGGTVDNVVGLIFNEDKSGYMAGALAGLMTETNTVAAVLGTDLVPPVVAFKEGYETGAKYVNPDVTVISTYHPGGLDVAFTDPEWGATTAKQALDSGADVVFGAGGKTGNGALIEAAGVEGVYCIGVDSDQWFTVPEAHSCLISSAMKLITPGVFDLVSMYVDGAPVAGNFYGAFGLAPFHDFDGDVPNDVKDQLDIIRGQLLNDELATGYPPEEEVDLGVVTVGTNAEYPPFENVDEDGNIVGFDVDLMTAIAEEVGFEFEWVNTRWDGIFVALASGEFDAVISAATITAERAETVNFSDPYFNAGQVIVVQADNTDILGPDDLAGKMAGVQLGTTGDIWLTDETEAEVVRFDENTLAFQALANGDVDAAVADSTTAAELVRANPEMNLKLLPDVYTDEYYGIAVIKEREDLLAAINEGLAAVKASGKYDEIYAEYFGTE